MCIRKCILNVNSKQSISDPIYIMSSRFGNIIHILLHDL